MSRYIIDKSKLIENINIIKNKAGVEVIGVVKGNGYGFGMCSLAEILMQNEINTFAVTEVYDVPLLRETVIDRDILVMRSTSIEEEAKIIAENDCIATIGSLSAAEVMDKVSKKLNKKTKCHLKIDTGMGRYGFLPSEVEKAIKCYDFENLDFCGAYTHFSSAFHNAELTKVQLEMFKDTIEQIKKAGKNVGILHAANSPALLNVDGVTLDAVRIGSAFTGRVITRGKIRLTSSVNFKQKLSKQKLYLKAIQLATTVNIKQKEKPKSQLFLSAILTASACRKVKRQPILIGAFSA